MFIYLSKKIAIPNGVNLRSLSWNPDQGWIACGGDAGLLKVLKLELTLGVRGEKRSNQGVAAPSNLSMNQTLEGHDGKVLCVTWNPVYRKLTTSDESGLIIVWTLHRGMWLEEMMNNRNRSVVGDMKWTSDGKKIGIVYEDGYVIVGSVDGSRLWGRELNMPLNLVEWSPDTRYILFVSGNDVYAYDAMGNRVKQLPLPAVEDLADGKEDDELLDSRRVIAVDWYDGAEGQADANAPTLVIGFQCGRVQVTRGMTDNDPIIIDTELETLAACKWNTRGSVLAVAGSKRAGESRNNSVVKFYTPLGHHIRTLKVPGTGINSLSWEGGGLRIALAVDAYIYFANIRPDYDWGYFDSTLVYAYTRPERTDSTVLFWNELSGDVITKQISALKCIRAAGDLCLIVTGPHPQTKEYQVTLCNAIGSPIDKRTVRVRPLHVALTPYHVIVSDERVCYIWQYKTQLLKLTASDQAKALENQFKKTAGRERMIDIDGDETAPAEPLETFSYPTNHTNDPITAVAASPKALLIARESGVLHRYTLPHMSLEGKHSLKCQPALLQLNCDSTRASIIDVNGILSIYAFDEAPEGGGESKGTLLPLERKDSWDVCWASDNPKMFAVMEKTRMYVFDDLEAQDPTLSSGYLASFSELSVKAVLLDEIMLAPDKPEKELIVEFETKALRELRELMENRGRPEAFAQIEQRPHKKLWRLLAEHALNALDLPMADKALVKCGDYPGIQFVKRVQSLSDKMKQRAEVAVYFERFDEAEAIYRDIDRNDLAIDVRVRQGDWFKVVSLVQKGGGDDRLLTLAMSQIGEYYAERNVWDKAAQYFLQAKQHERMVDAYTRLGDFKNLAKMIRMVPQGTPLLLELARIFENHGLNDPAVECYLKANDVRAAVDCCVLLNHWQRAVSLAEEHNFPQIEGLLMKYVRTLLDKGDKLLAVELYRNANKATEAAKLLAIIAEEVSRDHADPLRAKKLHVLAALEVERFRKAALDMTVTGTEDIAQTTAKTLNTLMTMDEASDSSGGSKVLDNAWRGAAAYHYYLLAQRQLYGGNIDAAMKTAIRLAEYEDVLSPREIYSLIALTAYHNQHFGICSRAFIKLETMPQDAQEDDYAEQVQNLALQIFTKHSPLDPSSLPQPYLDCLDTGAPYSACTASGRLINIDTERNCLHCKTCRHYVLEREMERATCCPLCHTQLL